MNNLKKGIAAVVRKPTVKRFCDHANVSISRIDPTAIRAVQKYSLMYLMMMVFHNLKNDNAPWNTGVEYSFTSKHAVKVNADKGLFISFRPFVVLVKGIARNFVFSHPAFAEYQDRFDLERDDCKGPLNNVDIGDIRMFYMGVSVFIFDLLKTADRVRESIDHNYKTVKGLHVDKAYKIDPVGSFYNTEQGLDDDFFGIDATSRGEEDADHSILFHIGAVDENDVYFLDLDFSTLQEEKEEGEEKEEKEEKEGKEEKEEEEEEEEDGNLAIIVQTGGEINGKLVIKRFPNNNFRFNDELMDFDLDGVNLKDIQLKLTFETIELKVDVKITKTSTKSVIVNLDPEMNVEQKTIVTLRNYNDKAKFHFRKAWPFSSLNVYDERNSKEEKVYTALYEELDNLTTPTLSWGDIGQPNIVSSELAEDYAL